MPEAEPRVEVLAQSRFVGEQFSGGFRQVLRVGKLILLECKYALSYDIVHQRAFLYSLTNYAE